MQFLLEFISVFYFLIKIFIKEQWAKNGGHDKLESTVV